MYNHDEYRIIRVTESSFLFFFSFYILSMLKLYSIRSLVLPPTILSPFLTLMHYTVTHQLAISQFLTFNTPTNGSIYLKFTHRLVKICTNMFMSCDSNQIIRNHHSGDITRPRIKLLHLVYNCHIYFELKIFTFHTSKNF